MFEIKPMYLISDFMVLFNYKHWASAKSMLEKLNIPLHWVGQRYVIYLSDIQIYAPDLYASILETHNIKMLKNEQINPDFATKSQFKA